MTAFGGFAVLLPVRKAHKKPRGNDSQRRISLRQGGPNRRCPRGRDRTKPESFARHFHLYNMVPFSVKW